MNYKWLLCLTCIVALAPLSLWVYNKSLPQQPMAVATIDFTEPYVEKHMEPGVSFLVKSVQIRDGFIYVVLLENGAWIEAHLTHATKEEATPVAIEILRASPTPAVTLKRKMKNYWIVDFQVTVGNNSMNLIEVLREQNLVF